MVVERKIENSDKIYRISSSEKLVSIIARFWWKSNPPKRDPLGNT